MTQHFSPIDANRLLRLSEEVSRIAGSLAKLSNDVGEQRPVHVGGSSDQLEVTEQSVRWLINIRNQRSRFLPCNLFADPAWDILLELYRAEIAGQRISVSSLCIAANAPSTTALRYIKTMVQEGMILREPDRFDARRVYVTLAPETSAALRNYFVNVVEMPFSQTGARRQSL